MSIDVTGHNLSDDARDALIECYVSDPETVRTLSTWPGRIGKLASLCCKVGGDTHEN